jgi:hypothetical protein
VTLSANNPNTDTIAEGWQKKLRFPQYEAPSDDKHKYSTVVIMLITASRATPTEEKFTKACFLLLQELSNLGYPKAVLIHAMTHAAKKDNQRGKWSSVNKDRQVKALLN